MRLNGAEAILPCLSQVMVGWPFRSGPATPAAGPFFSISSQPDSAMLWCESRVEDRPARQFDTVNAVCDVIASLALALPAEDPKLICLHAAAVAMAGRLVVFPSVRRAGKSTLSVALARAGHALFGDDVLPVSVTTQGQALGHAMGISPRLRLPLPATLDADFRFWAGAAAGPRNAQYHYVTLDGQPAHGVTLPVGAFVILDRQDDPCPARLDPVSPAEAMDALLHQHFTRDRHSADVLQAMAAALTNLPVFRLTYCDLAGAVDCLTAAFAAWPGPDQPVPTDPPQAFRTVGADPVRQVALSLDARTAQRPGTVAQVIGDRLYLADRDGRAIHRTDPLSAAIWELLAEPITRAEIEAVLEEAFPDTAPDRIAADLYRLLAEFHLAGLTESHPALPQE